MLRKIKSESCLVNNETEIFLVVEREIIFYLLISFSEDTICSSVTFHFSTNTVQQIFHAEWFLHNNLQIESGNLFVYEIPINSYLRNILSNASNKKYTYINFDFEFVGNRNHWKLIVTYVKYVCQITLTKKMRIKLLFLLEEERLRMWSKNIQLYQVKTRYWDKILRHEFNRMEKISPIFT